MDLGLMAALTELFGMVLVVIPLNILVKQNKS